MAKQQASIIGRSSKPARKGKKGFDESLAAKSRPCQWGVKHPDAPCGNTFQSGYEGALYCATHSAQSAYDNAVVATSNATEKMLDLHDGMTVQDVFVALVRDVTAEVRDRADKRAAKEAGTVTTTTVDPADLEAFLAFRAAMAEQAAQAPALDR